MGIFIIRSDNMKEIIVFSDFACPFCYIGFSIMNKLRKEDRNIKFTFLPSILNPNESLEGGSLSNEVDQDTIHEGFKRIEILAKEYNLKYNNKMRRFNTNRLHLASQYAQEKGKFFEFAELGFKYIFEYGKNIAKNNIVDEIAVSVGLDIDDMNKRIDNNDFNHIINDSKKLANSYEVESIPTFIVDGKKKPTHLKEYDEFIKDLL